MSFEKALIKVEHEKEFEELKAAIGRAFDPQRVEQFLKRLNSDGVRIRDWDALLQKKVLEREDEVLKKSGNTAEKLYGALTVSDQAQMREFYLSQIEEVSDALRHRFKKIFQYY